MLGTLNRLKNQAPRTGDAPAVNAGLVQEGPSSVSRVRMVANFVDTVTDPASPRLVRQLAANTPNAVAFEIEAFRLTYDIADGTVNPAARMTSPTSPRWRLQPVRVLGEPDPQGERGHRDSFGAPEQAGRLLPQHTVHASRAA